MIFQAGMPMDLTMSRYIGSNILPTYSDPQEEPKSGEDFVQHDSELPTVVDKVSRFHSSEEVQRYLPDILGKALAHMWVDEKFRLRFAENPKKILEDMGVFMPSSILVDYVQMARSRPQIVVYHVSPDGRFKTRLLYLQLVMMAGK